MKYIFIFIAANFGLAQTEFNAKIKINYSLHQSDEPERKIVTYANEEKQLSYFLKSTPKELKERTTINNEVDLKNTNEYSIKIDKIYSDTTAGTTIVDFKSGMYKKLVLDNETNSALLINDTINKIPWKLLNKSKKIDNIKCSLATFTNSENIFYVWSLASESLDFKVA